jgi:hypothetical protein
MKTLSMRRPLPSMLVRLLAEPPGQKIVFNLQLADLTEKFADLDFAGLDLAIAAALEHASRAVEQRLLPGMDLTGVDTELAGQFANRAIALERRQGHISGVHLTLRREPVHCARN